MTTLAICNHKGGTGKTTSTMNLAAAFGLSGSRVLVVDLDPQGFLTRMLGVSEPAAASSSLVLFGHEVDYDALPIARLNTFDLIPASPALSSAMRRLNKPTDVLWLKEFTDGVDSSYDLVLYDTAAAVTVYSLNAMAASEHVLIPVLPEYQPVVGAEQTYQTSMVVKKKLNPGMEVPRLILTMVDGRKRNHYAYRQYLRDRYGERVLKTTIRTCTTLSVTLHDGLTVFESNPYARGSIDYANAADEMICYLGLDAKKSANSAESRIRSLETLQTKGLSV